MRRYILDEFDHDRTSWRHWKDGNCKGNHPQMALFQRRFLSGKIIEVNRREELQTDRNLNEDAFLFFWGDFECAKKTLGRVRKWRIPIYHRNKDFDLSSGFFDEMGQDMRLKRPTFSSNFKIFQVYIQFWPIPILGMRCSEWTAKGKGIEGVTKLVPEIGVTGF